MNVEDVCMFPVKITQKQVWMLQNQESVCVLKTQQEGKGTVGSYHRNHIP